MSSPPPKRKVQTTQMNGEGLLGQEAQWEYMTPLSLRRTHSLESQSDVQVQTAPAQQPLVEAQKAVLKAQVDNTDPTAEVQYPPFALKTPQSQANNDDVAVQTPPLSPQSTGMTDMTSSIGSLNERLNISTTIPESRELSHLSSPIQSPVAADSLDAPTRNSSTRSLWTRAQRIPGVNSRRNSRRSTSANGMSASPAHAFLSSWGGKATEPAPEPQPDDEGQTFGIKDDREYVIGRKIGSGAFGVVKEVQYIDDDSGTRRTGAVKIVQKNVPGISEQQNEQMQAALEHEVSVWRYLKHRHILDLHAVYDTDYATFCVMELVEGGTLFDIVKTSRNAADENAGRKGLEPSLARRYAYQLACALRYLHEDIRVCHRDIKLENCLIDMKNPDIKTGGGNLRLCDFGLADFLRDESLDEALDRFDALSPESSLPRPTTTHIIGTLEYASPKGVSVQRKLFETAGDVWAFGVIIYALCTGDLPFKHVLPSKTVELILHADWDLNALKSVAAGSEDVVELVRGCLETDIDLRMSIGEVLKSPWFEGCRSSSDEDEGSGNVWR